MKKRTTPQFDAAYAMLNERQRMAVQNINGPLMVIAGPGTGKTQLLSTRVGYILNETDLRPFNILCITYTNSGVTAMKKRLVEMLGPDGHDIEVFTFHSFAEKIIQRFYQYKDREDYTFLDDLEKRTILRDLLNKVDFNTALKKGVSSVDSALGFLSSFIDTIKKEKYDVDKLIYYYEEEKQTKKDSPEFIYTKAYGKFKKGDFKEGIWKAFEHKLDKHIQAANLYKEYDQIMLERKLLDYSDLILEAIQLIQDHEDLRYDLMEQYQMIMIDEFQDTNGSQFELINELCRETEDPNIMVVGDEDQSIFRFQGANLKNIFDFHKLYLADRSPAEQIERIVVLDQNYRSTPSILESSRLLISNNSERIEHIVSSHQIIKKLEAANEEVKWLQEHVEFIEVENKEDQNIPIALEIERLVQSGVAYSDIAVLFPTNSQIIECANYLSLLDYPYEMSKEEDILEDRLILSLLQVLRTISNFKLRKNIDREDIAAMLMHPWAKIPLTDIAEFWVDLREKNPESFLDYIEKYRGVASIERVFQRLAACIQKQGILPANRFFHLVLDSFEIKEWAILQENRLEILQKIEVLDAFLLAFTQSKESVEMIDFLNHIEAYQREDIAIPYIRHIVRENSIQLMTYHKSKGLEFDYVFVYGAGRASGNNQNKIYVPEACIDKDLSEDKEKSQAEEEKRRLLYVAMTRAKRKLYLIDRREQTKENKDTNKFKSELPIVSEKIRAQTPDIEALMTERIYSITEVDYLRFMAINQTKLEVKNEILFENQYVDQRIKNFVLSHSSVNAYLECPQKFFFEKIIKMPSERNLAMSTGNFYHKVLEIYFNQIKLNSAAHTLATLIDIAQKEIYHYSYLMTDHEFKDLQKSLDTNLPILYEQYLSEPVDYTFEAEAKHELSIGEATVTGVFDKWEKRGTELRIIDYKTGRISNAEKGFKLSNIRAIDKIKDPDHPTVSELYGGDYWRQAVLYHLMAKKTFPDLDLEKVEFVFIIPEDKQIHRAQFSPTKEDEDFVKNLILTVHRKIQNKEFEGCKKTDCPWCQTIAERQASQSA